MQTTESKSNTNNNLSDVNSNDNATQSNLDSKYKTKDYIRRAVNNYKKKRYAEDIDYRNKQILQIKECQLKNSEKYKEYKRNYMRQYRE